MHFLAPFLLQCLHVAKLGSLLALYRITFVHLSIEHHVSCPFTVIIFDMTRKVCKYESRARARMKYIHCV